MFSWISLWHCEVLKLLKIAFFFKEHYLVPVRSVFSLHLKQENVTMSFLINVSLVDEECIAVNY